MQEIIIDTNVWSHSQNPNERLFNDSVIFVSSVKDININLVLDDQEFILTEYLEHLGFGSAASAIISFFIVSGRISYYSSRVEQKISRRINKLIPNNKRDRTFVKVAVNSVDKSIVSHDFNDFNNNVRNDALELFHIRFFDSRSIMAEL